MMMMMMMIVFALVSTCNNVTVFLDSDSLSRFRHFFLLTVFIPFNSHVSSTSEGL